MRLSKIFSACTALVLFTAINANGETAKRKPSSEAASSTQMAKFACKRASTSLTLNASSAEEAVSLVQMAVFLADPRASYKRLGGEKGNFSEEVQVIDREICHYAMAGGGKDFAWRLAE